MTLLYPEFFWLLIPLALFGWLRYRQESSQALPIHPKVLIENRRTLFVRLAPFVALAWMLAALARPVVQSEKVEKTPGLTTLYLAIDASRSMRATDRKPDRFGFAKRTIEKLVEKDRSHRFALIAFTTNALILSPPTEDAELIHAALESFNPDFILTHGTSLKSLLETVAKLAGERKELVIFSDGGDGEEEVGELFAIARKSGVRIHGAACATRTGSKIPMGGGWLRDEAGRLVVSTLDPRLERLSLETGGAFVDEGNPEEAARAILESLEVTETESEEASIRTRELFWIPLLIGLLFYLAGTLSMRAPGRVWAAISLLLGIQAQAGLTDIWRLEAGYEAYAQRRYEDAGKIFASIRPPLFESTYALANTYYRLGAWKRAGRLYLKCKTSDPELKRRIWYNLGNCAMKMGRYESAVDYYVKALQLGYDEDAVANLKTALFLKERRKKRIEPKADEKARPQSASGTAERKEEAGKKESSKSRAKMGKGSGSSTAAKSTRIRKERAAAEAARRHPLGSRAYETINRGYVHEKRPW